MEKFVSMKGSNKKRQISKKSSPDNQWIMILKKQMKKRLIFVDYYRSD